MIAKQSRKRILIVDDAELFVAGLKELLEQKGFEVVTTTNGIDGLLALSQSTFDLVLLDITMPELGGLAMLKKMRQEPWSKDMPVLILTSSRSSSPHFQQALKLGTTDYLVKEEWKGEQISTYITTFLAQEM